jgi:hypothetical protein
VEHSISGLQAHIATLVRAHRERQAMNDTQRQKQDAFYIGCKLTLEIEVSEQEEPQANRAKKRRKAGLP